MSANRVRIRLEPLSIDLELAPGSALQHSLAEHGIEFPCGGEGICGGCAVRVLAGSLSITPSDREHFTQDQLAGGCRLACKARAEMPMVLECGQWRMDVLADGSRVTGSGKQGLGIAIDVGTTTIAAQMLDLACGDVLGLETLLNPQARFGSDVMSRIHAALSGADLTTAIRTALRQTVVKLAAGREEEVREVVLVGNTVMHHLFSRCDVEPLAHVPFASPHLAEQRFEPRELDWPLPDGCVIRFIRCLGGFVGADIRAGIVATGLARSDDLAALVDLGTNGEIAIGNRDRIVCASTAAGPAFEAGAIRMGMRAATGAIAHVSLRDGQMHASVIGATRPRGICGSGLVDAVAMGLKSGAILPSGRIAHGAKLVPIADPVVLCQPDIRELQLAKGAIAAGFKLLLKRIGAGFSDLKRVHLAGAFGNYVQIDSALAIGLLMAPREVIHAAGNTALGGAKQMLLVREEPVLPQLEHVSLAAEPDFQDEFAVCMAFPELAAVAVQVQGQSQNRQPPLSPTTASP